MGRQDLYWIFAEVQFEKTGAVGEIRQFGQSVAGDVQCFQFVHLAEDFFVELAEPVAMQV